MCGTAHLSLASVPLCHTQVDALALPALVTRARGAFAGCRRACLEQHLSDAHGICTGTTAR